MRKKLYDIIEPADGGNILSSIYDYFMIVIIILSLIPLAFKTDIVAFDVIEKICVIIFILDYLLRLFTADLKRNNKSIISFLIYPFTPIAIIDLVSILPSLIVINNGFRLLRIVRLARAMRVFRVFKAARYSKNMKIIIGILRKSKDSLMAVFTLAIVYIIISAMIVFNVEPDSFGDFFDAVYWATVSLTTIGYGDIYPITTIGRIVTMISSVLGVAVVALPAGIITAEYMNELNNQNSDEK